MPSTTFSRRHYVAIGDAVRRALYMDNEQGCKRLVAAELANVFAADNPRFDRERFLQFVETGKDVR